MSTAKLPTQPLLAHWFGPLQDGLCSDARRKALFRADPEFDASLREAFAGSVDAALDGALDAAVATPLDRLALVLLCDQLTRNLGRGTARAFAGDARALAQVRRAIEGGEDRELAVEHRAFLYMPFQHAEDLPAQREGLGLFDALYAEQTPGSAAAAAAKGYLGHAREHAALVERFGRFPHRNAVLGRTSSDAEREHLARDGRSFGQ